MTLAEAIEYAAACDDNYERAVLAQGYKSRWDVPRTIKFHSADLARAYWLKVDADNLMGNAFAISRGEKPTMNV